MSELQYREALNQALAEEMQRDANVFLMGEEVARYNGAYKVSQGLLDRFGSARVVDAPISELGFAGLGIGAAMVGLRPVIEMMTWNFAILAMDQIVNQAAHLRYMTGGQTEMPLVIRMPTGAGAAYAAQHSQTLYGMYAYIPGLRVVVPSNPADAAGLMRTALREPNPVLFFAHKTDYGRRGMVPDGGPSGAWMPASRNGRATPVRTPWKRPLLVPLALAWSNAPWLGPVTVIETVLTRMCSTRSS